MYVKRYGSFVLLVFLICGCTSLGLQPDSVDRKSAIERGRFLVQTMGCNDCHTPGFMKNPPASEDDWLVGSKVGFQGPQGTVYPANLRLLFSRVSLQGWLTLAGRLDANLPMASLALAKLPDEDLVSLYYFIESLGPRGEPVPARVPAGVKPESDYLILPDPH